MSETDIGLENITICITIDGQKHYPVVGTKDSMDVLRGTVLRAMDSLNIGYTSKMGHLEFKKD